MNADKVTSSKKIFLIRFGIITLALLTLHVLATLYNQLGEASQILNELAQSGVIPIGYEEEIFNKQQKYTTLANYARPNHGTTSPMGKREQFLETDPNSRREGRIFRRRIREKVFTFERRFYESDHRVTTSSPDDHMEKTPPGRVQGLRKYGNGKNVEKIQAMNSRSNVRDKNEYKNNSGRSTNYKIVGMKQSNNFHIINNNNRMDIEKSNNNGNRNSSSINNRNSNKTSSNNENGNKNNNDKSHNNSNKKSENNDKYNNSKYNSHDKSINNRDNNINNSYNNKNNNSDNNNGNNNNNKINNKNINKSNRNNNFVNNIANNVNYTIDNSNSYSNDMNNITNNKDKYNIANEETLFHNKKKDKKNMKENNKSSEKKRKSTRRSKIMILAYHRSGSSFVGEMFNRNPQVFYTFEPIHPIEKVAGGGKYPRLYETLVGNLLDVIYTCSFNKHPFLVNFLSKSPFRLKSEALVSSGLCAKNATPDNISHQCRPLNQTILKRLCNSRDHVVVKTIRASSRKFFEYFADSNSHDVVRLIHLVRDPRAIINSRLHLYMNANDDGVHLERNATFINALRRSVRVASANLCSRIHSDIKYGQREGSGAYLLLRFEDAAMHPHKIYSKISGFSGIQESAKVRQWLLRNTVVTGTHARNDYNDYSTSRNSKAAVNGWRKALPFKLVTEIQDQCSDVMNMLGYLLARDERQLVDMESSLVSFDARNVIFKTVLH